MLIKKMWEIFKLFLPHNYLYFTLRLTSTQEYIHLQNMQIFTYRQHDHIKFNSYLIDNFKTLIKIMPN